MVKKDFDFLVVEPSVKVRRSQRIKRVSVTSKHKKATPQRIRKQIRKANSVARRKARAPIERRADYISDYHRSPFSEDYLCQHEHHMNCVRCGLLQFLIGLVTGMTMALVIARLIF